MNLTKIEWAKNQDGSQGYTCNPVKGYCPVACSYCYARAMYDRFGWDKTIRYDSSAWFKGVDIESLKKPSRIFVGSTIELFGPWVKEEWIKSIMATAQTFPQHTFIFLTKRPWELPKWNPWPDNAWVGATATNLVQYRAAIVGLQVIEAKTKFISIEPLLEHIPIIPPYKLDGLQGVIIGAQTNPYRPPKLEWVREIVEAADQVGIPVFLKNNLHLNVSGKDTWALSPNVGKGELWRQEFPGVTDE